jgi:hypothetical protein
VFWRSVSTWTSCWCPKPHISVDLVAVQDAVDDRGDCELLGFGTQDGQLAAGITGVLSEKPRIWIRRRGFVVAEGAYAFEIGEKDPVIVVEQEVGGMDIAVGEPDSF